MATDFYFIEPTMLSSVSESFEEAPSSSLPSCGARSQASVDSGTEEACFVEVQTAGKDTVGVKCVDRAIFQHLLYCDHLLQVDTSTHSHLHTPSQSPAAGRHLHTLTSTHSHLHTPSQSPAVGKHLPTHAPTHPPSHLLQVDTSTLRPHTPSQSPGAGRHLHITPPHPLPVTCCR